VIVCDRVLVSDIDGTLLKAGRPTAGLETLRWMIDRDESGMRLVYATGRTMQSVLELVHDGTLPEPHAVASLVGTEVWLPPWRRADAAYAARITEHWNRERLLETASLVDELELQPTEFQSPHKLSFFVDGEGPVCELQRRLRETDLRYRTIYSGSRFLDLMPERAGKLAAIEFITSRWDARSAAVLAAGDSLNDRDMLVHPRFFGVIVANADDELSGAVTGPRLHEATLPFAAGVLEGAEVFDFWSHKRHPAPRQSSR
jgi:sucrose-6F-phosphate phosphohydrolase